MRAVIAALVLMVPLAACEESNPVLGSGGWQDGDIPEAVPVPDEAEAAPAAPPAPTTAPAGPTPPDEAVAEATEPVVDVAAAPVIEVATPAATPALTPPPATPPATAPHASHAPATETPQ